MLLQRKRQRSVRHMMTEPLRFKGALLPFSGPRAAAACPVWRQLGEPSSTRSALNGFPFICHIISRIAETHCRHASWYIHGNILLQEASAPQDAFISSLICSACFPSFPLPQSHLGLRTLSWTLPNPRLTRPPFGSFITGLPPRSGDDHLSSSGSHNHLVNALIAFSLCVGYTGRGSIIS